MKYIVILCDGMADEPLESLSGKTPLEAAKTLNMDRLAKNAEIGMVQTVPKGMSPGSDTANLSEEVLFRTFSVRSFEYRRADGGLGCVFSVQPCYIDRG